MSQPGGDYIINNRLRKPGSGTGMVYFQFSSSELQCLSFFICFIIKIKSGNEVPNLVCKYRYCIKESGISSILRAKIDCQGSCVSNFSGSETALLQNPGCEAQHFFLFAEQKAPYHYKSTKQKNKFRNVCPRFGEARLILRGAGGGEDAPHKDGENRSETVSEDWVLPKRRRLLHPRILPIVHPAAAGAFNSSTAAPYSRAHAASPAPAPAGSLPTDGLLPAAPPAETATRAASAAALPALHQAAADGQFWAISKLIEAVRS